MAVADEVSRCAMEAADEIKVEGTKTMPIAILDLPEIGGVEAMRTGKGNRPRNASTVARKPTARTSAGKSEPIRREPDPDTPTKEIGSDRTTSKNPEKPEKGQPS